jgi:hypothetical protein
LNERTVSPAAIVDHFVGWGREAARVGDLTFDSPASNLGLMQLANASLRQFRAAVF